jgi:GT2 family glycosyltransferase
MISIIIVSWNAKAYLLKCLASLANETYPLEIIVVDNNSSDGSPEAVAREYPKVKLIRSPENLGFAKANNLGIKAATGDYLAFVNNDVEVFPGCIPSLVAFSAAHPRVGVVGPQIFGGKGGLQKSYWGFPTLVNRFARALALDNLFKSRAFSGYSTYGAKDDYKPVDVLQGSFLLVKREALDRVGPWDEDFFIYGEDVDWCRRFWDDGWEVMFLASARAIHYGGSSSANAPVRFYIEKQKADLQYWRKHESPLAVQGYIVLSCLHESLRTAGYGLLSLFKPSARFKANRSLACLRWLLSGGTSNPEMSSAPKVSVKPEVQVATQK